MTDADGRTADGTRWLDPAEEEAWLAVVGMVFQLPAELDQQLQHDSQLRLFEYFVLSRLSMAPGRTLRMSELAGLTNGSLSRLSNVVKRLEGRGWIRRQSDPQDGRYTIAELTENGWQQVLDAAPGHVSAVRRFLIDLLSPGQLRQLAEIGTSVTARCAGADPSSAAPVDVCEPIDEPAQA